MQRNVKETDSYKREKSADIANKVSEDINTTDITAKGISTTDEAVKNVSTTDKIINEKYTSDKNIIKDITAGIEVGYSPEVHARDANSHTIFHNRKLTCQFLRDYTGLSIFKDLQPEDIEDVTERYKAFLGVQFEADTVKKVRIRGDGKEEGTEVFVLPLVEHKTDVDYDVAMQLLRYMAVIWYDYKRQQDTLKAGTSSLKSFRYPPIIPIVLMRSKMRFSLTRGLVPAR